MGRRGTPRIGSLLLSALAVSCAGPTSPDSSDPTGYLMTVTAGTSCRPAFPEPVRVIVKYQGEFSAWHVFTGLRTIGSPRDPALEVRLKNLSAGVIEGSVYAGFSSSGGMPAMYFRAPDSPAFPVRIPFTGAGDGLRSDVSGTLNAHIWNSAGACTASDHRLRFDRVFGTIE